MWYRIAIGAGLFLLGYTLGRGFRRIEGEQGESRSTRIRDSLSPQESESAAPPYAATTPGSGGDIVRE
jgi:hypothetical protein